MNTQDVIIHILRTLVQAEGHPLAQDVLFLQVLCRVRPRPTDAEIEECLRVMKQRGLIMQQASELDIDGNNPLWLLDEKGQVMATRMRL